MEGEDGESAHQISALKSEKHADSSDIGSHKSASASAAQFGLHLSFSVRFVGIGDWTPVQRNDAFY